MGKYRALTGEEIAQLHANGCVAEYWQNVTVAENFAPQQVRRVSFSGIVRLGSGVSISDSTISDYVIGDNVVISGVSRMYMEGESSFGIGFPVSCLNEAGGREVLLHEELSSQIAYVEAMYRHRPKLMAALQNFHSAAVSASKSRYGVVGCNVSIRNVGTVRNVRIGDNAVLADCLRLENGTVTDGCAGAGAYIGAGVICRNFVVLAGAEVSDSVNIDGVFVGQGVKLSKGFSAAASLFFANSHCENGEAAAVFAGPYTVSHHKSTLLIGGLFSYMNAGSNTNFSNHLYKLGPLHHGVFERGVKFGSGSYMMLPARVGAYSTVLGHHKRHFDSSEFPFSYLLEKDGITCLVPGVTLTGAGLLRDVEKWKNRDRRNGVQCLDIINNEALTPYTVSKMISGRRILIEELGRSESPEFSFDGFHISRKAAGNGRNRYSKVLIYYAGRVLFTRLKDGKFDSDDALRAALIPESAAGDGQWADVGGMIVPQSELETVLDELENGKVSSFAGLLERLAGIERNYSEYEWKWVYEHFILLAGFDLGQICRKQILEFIKEWVMVADSLCGAVWADASKEFAEDVMFGFGIDGDREVAIDDFNSVRGVMDSSDIARRIKDLGLECSRLAYCAEKSLSL